MSNKTFWTMKNGEQIDVDKMSLQHLKNTLKLLINNDCINTNPDDLETDEYGGPEFWKD